jgi:hypothetical protein
MKLYKVKRFDKTFESVLVQANSKEEAQEIAQMDHIYMNNGEILESSYKTEVVKEKPIGRIVHTKTGYIDADGITHNIK